ncbi:MAG: hemerythrin family protein [Gammaproteobacteria bacterium]|nr:hemerythrin family protein [Gammaproteobacteria bacterium]MCP5198980.1 hemerythrin family protein [Gammaproteobacteria bacterium]
MHESIPHWDARFELGREDGDLQHRYFLNLVNRLAGALSDARGVARRAALLAELKAYDRFHLLSEENLMQRDAYPGLARHRRLHDELFDALSSREHAVSLADEATTVDDIVRFLVEWCVHHTAGEDRLYAEFRQQAAGR